MRFARFLLPVVPALVAFALMPEDASRAQPDPGATITKEVVLTGALFPVGLDFAPDGRLFYTEHCTGNVRIVTPDDQLLPQPFAHIDVTPACGDWGLTGITVDPEFTTNHYVYVAYMKHVSSNPLIARPIVVRFTEVNNVGTEQTVVVDNLPDTVPNTQRHHGIDEIHFGPDGYLYVSIGDLDNPDPVSQDLSRTEGKILRVNKADGSAPPDNPFVNTPGADPRIYAYGLRNSYGYTWHSQTGAIFATENGPANCDELNIIVPGGNYGWPIPYEPNSCDVAIGIQPIHWFTFFPWEYPWTTSNGSAPAGIVHVDGDIYPALGDSLLACQWKTVQMAHLRLTPAADGIAQAGMLVNDCNVAVEIAPSGAIYYTGGGYNQDDTIFRLRIDSDSDTVIDGTDNCPAAVNLDQANTIHPASPAGDACDDPDADAVFDITDNCPDTPNPGQDNNVHPATTQGDACDDPDADAVFDIADNCPDIPNPAQDNIVHPATTQGDACEDPDADTVFDIADNCPDTPNPGQANDVHPASPAGDACEDPDADTVFDITDNCPDTPNPAQEDLDGDALGDPCDADDDNDLVYDIADNCPDTPNPGQANNVHPASPQGDACEDPDADTVFDITDNCPDTPNRAQDNNVHPANPQGDACEDPDADTVFDITDNCPDTPNLAQENLDGDALGDPCDADDDNDLVHDTDEPLCGSDPLDVTPPLSRPERLDGAFSGVDDNGDTSIDEPLPPGSEAFDCDGDGWTGNQENLIYLDAPSTARDQDPCGNNGWPADLAASNTLNVADIGSFLSPARLAADFGSGGAFNTFGHNLDDDGDTVIESSEDPGAPGGLTFNLARWNLALPPHTATTAIDIGDLNALITGAVGSGARPPMFGDQQAFFTNSGACPYPP